MKSNLVTVVMVARDRFSYACECIEAVYKFSDIPFDFVYIDGGSPKDVQKKLQEQAHDKGFKCVRADRYLTPNEARNMAMPYVTGKYILYIDNDCLPIKAGWLSPLVSCAEETGATIVGPLVLEGWPEPHLIHFAGGLAHFENQQVNGQLKKILVSSLGRQGEKYDEVKNILKREKTELSEIHCLMVRTDFVKKLGKWDEGITGSREHIDFCLEAQAHGGSVYFEPASVVRFMPEPPLGPPLEPMDMDFYCLRWNNTWWKQSIDHLAEKWGIAKDEGYLAKRYEDTGWRTKAFVVKPMARKLALGLRVPFLEALIYRLVLKKTDALLEKYEKQKANA